MGRFLIIHQDLSLPCCIHTEWPISLRFFAGDLSLPCGIALTKQYFKTDGLLNCEVLTGITDSRLDHGEHATREPSPDGKKRDNPPAAKDTSSGT